MDTLGERGQCLICLETPSEFELIVPHALLPKVVRREEGLSYAVVCGAWHLTSPPAQVLYAFRPNKFSCTGSYRMSDGPWLPFSDHDKLPGVENIPPAWLRAKLPKP
jgi:hypothetical protein